MAAKLWNWIQDLMITFSNIDSFKETRVSEVMWIHKFGLNHIITLDFYLFLQSTKTPSAN